MDIWSLDKVILFVAFVIPGFISLKTYALFYPGVPDDPARQLVDAVAYSCINYGLLLAPIWIVEESSLRTYSPVAYAAFYFFVLLISPVLWVLALKQLRASRVLSSMLPHPTAKPWDFVFGQHKGYWVVVTLRDGLKVAGLYCRGSFTSSSPAPEQIYLQENWVLNQDGGFERPRQDTAGILILAADIVTIEFFKIQPGES